MVNLLLVPSVLLTSYQVIVLFEMRLRGVRLEGPLDRIVDMTLILYVNVFFFLGFGLFLYEVALLLLPCSWPTTRRRLAAVALSPIVPGTMLVLPIGPGPLFSPTSLIAAGFVFGAAARIPGNSRRLAS
jgi:hypothetical protein